jgi:hypothetical protein
VGCAGTGSAVTARTRSAAHAAAVREARSVAARIRSEKAAARR